jgi:hypothetical protein
LHLVPPFANQGLQLHSQILVPPPIAETPHDQLKGYLSFSFLLPTKNLQSFQFRKAFKGTALLDSTAEFGLVIGCQIGVIVCQRRHAGVKFIGTPSKASPIVTLFPGPE